MRVKASLVDGKGKPVMTIAFRSQHHTLMNVVDEAKKALISEIDYITDEALETWETLTITINR
jgi:hypothetical protein